MKRSTLEVTGVVCKRARNLRVDSGFDQVVDQRLSRSVSWLYLPVVLAAMLLLAVAPEANAQFRGKNGQIFYISADTSGNQRVFSSRVSGSGRRIVSPPGLYPSSVAVSPNGRTLAICGGRAGDEDYWIFLGRTSGGKFRRVVKGCDPGFSPSGRRLVYTITLPDGLRQRFEIRTVKTNGSSRRTILRPSDRWLYDTQFTPNGKRIVFTATIDPNVGDYDTEVYSIRARDGKRQEQITNDGGFDIDYRNPDVSPGGKRVVVSAYDGFMNRRSVVTVPISGGPIDIIASPDSDQFDFDDPMYSPDGKRMLLERSDSAFDEYYLIFQNRLTGAVPNQALLDPPLLVPSPAASAFGAFGPVWAPKPR
jgi:Tol biopolymer transport system component